MTDYLDSIRNHEFLLNFNTIENATEKQHINVGAQCNFTPLVEIEKRTGFRFLKHITPNMKKVLFMFNIEFIEYVGIVSEISEKCPEYNYLKNIEYTVAYDSEFDKRYLDMFICRYNLNVKPVNIIEFSETKKIKVIEKAMTGKHFDIVFSNPPYNKNIDLQILQTVFGHTDKAVFIHPAGYLLDKKFKTKIYNEVRNTNYLEKAILVWGNQMFNIGLFMPLTISVWNKNKTSDECIVNDMAISHTNYTCKINDISIHPAWITAWKNSLNITKTLESEVTPHGQLSDYSVRCALIRTGVTCGIDGFTGHFTSIFGLDIDNYKCDHTFEFSKASREHGCIQAHWAFENENIRENFLEYCKTKVVRFLLSFVKNGPNVGRSELAAIPWMDFTQEWNDAKLCEEFRIDEELWNYIDKFIPDYYEDYESGF